MWNAIARHPCCVFLTVLLVSAALIAVGLLSGESEMLVLNTSFVHRLDLFEILQLGTTLTYLLIHRFIQFSSKLII